VYQRGHYLKPLHAHLSGVVFTASGDSVIVEVAQFTNGKRSGTWYKLDKHEHVTAVFEYPQDGSEWVYRYDKNGRLDEYCRMIEYHDEYFYRIFGGGAYGTCWSFDSLRQVRHRTHEDTTGYFERVHYYPNGQPAERTSHDRTSGRLEQWCPTGKRVGLMTTSAISETEMAMFGTFILWSVMDHAYYAIDRTKGRWKLRELPNGRWRSYSDQEYVARDAQLKLQRIEYNDPDRPVALPCSLRKR
jgi:hypothetical protein